MNPELLFGWYALILVVALGLSAFMALYVQLKKKQFPEERQAVKKNMKLIGAVVGVYVVMTGIVIASGIFKA